MCPISHKTLTSLCPQTLAQTGRLCFRCSQRSQITRQEEQRTQLLSQTKPAWSDTLTRSLPLHSASLICQRMLLEGSLSRYLPEEL